MTGNSDAERPNQLRRRRTIRAREYDYSSPGTYFLTVCVESQQPLLAQVRGSGLELTHPGRIVEAAWYDLPNRFDWLDLDAFVVMPNHVHGIIVINSESDNLPADRATAIERHGVGATGVMNHAPTRRRRLGDGYAPVALGEIVRTFKAVATRSIRQAGGCDFAWQRNYYEHIIRSDRSLERIREYIDGNPGKWTEDRYFVEEAVRT